jgi:hypothetical protein
MKTRGIVPDRAGSGAPGRLRLNVPVRVSRSGGQQRLYDITPGPREIAAVVAAAAQR